MLFFHRYEDTLSTSRFGRSGVHGSAICDFCCCLRCFCVFLCCRLERQSVILSLPVSAPVSVIQNRASLGSECFKDASNEPSATQTFFQGLEQQTLEKNVQRKHPTSMAPEICIVGGGGASGCSAPLILDHMQGSSAPQTHAPGAQRPTTAGSAGSSFTLGSSGRGV